MTLVLTDSKTDPRPPSWIREEEERARRGPLRDHTPEEIMAIGRKNWETRRTYKTFDEDVMGPPIPEALQEEINELLERDRATPTTQGLEELQRQREISDEFSREYRWLKKAEYADEEMRKGNLMHSDEFLRRLREICKLTCWISEPWPLFGGKAVTLFALPKTDVQKVTWMQPGWMTEYELVHFDEHDIPLNPKHRGWRTILLKLIMTNCITEQEAEHAFGLPDRPCGFRYLATLAAWRNRPRQENGGRTEIPQLAQTTDAVEEEVSACTDCGRKYGNHNGDCPQYQQELNSRRN